MGLRMDQNLEDLQTQNELSLLVPPIKLSTRHLGEDGDKTRRQRAISY